MECTRASCCFDILLNMHIINKNKDYLFTDESKKAKVSTVLDYLQSLYLMINKKASIFSKVNSMVVIFLNMKTRFKFNNLLI